MGTIEILNDSDNVYKTGDRIGVMDFIQSYLDTNVNDGLAKWLYMIPIPEAVDFIANDWGIKYRFV